MMSARAFQTLVLIVLMGATPLWTDAVRGQQTTVSRELLADLVTQIEALQREVAQLRGQVEVQAHEIKRLHERIQTLTQDLDGRLRALERGGAAQSSRQSPVSASGTKPPVTADGTGNAQGDYDAAFRLLKQGDYTAAARSFRAFVARYPGHALTGNAQYWYAESNYLMRNFRSALKGYLVVLEDYSESRKVPDAMLKIGYTYYELGKWASARKFLNESMRRYPDTRIARSAKSYLEMMKREGH